MKRNKNSTRSLFAMGALALIFALAGCSSDDSSSAGPSTSSSAQQSANARSDAELQALADAAATASNIGSFDSVTTGNAGSLGNSEGDASDSTGFLSTPSGSFLNSRVAKALRKSKISMQRETNQLATRRGGSERYVVTDVSMTYNNNVFPCSGGGDITVNGTVIFTLDVADDGNSGTFTFGADDLTLDFDACSDGSHTLWGNTLANADDVMSISIASDGNSGTFSMSFDEYEDGGVVLQEDSSGDAYNFIWRFVFVANASGTYNINSDSTSFASLTFAAEVTLNGITCTTSGSGEAAANNPTWTCTGS